MSQSGNCICLDSVPRMRFNRGHSLLEGSNAERRHPTKRTEKMEAENKKLQGEKDLLAACASGDVSKVEKLVDSGVNVNSSDQNQMTALHYASMHTRDDVIKSLISRHAEVNSADMMGGFSAMHWVVINAVPKYSSTDHLEGSLMALTKAGCRVNAPDFNLATPLHIAAQKGNRDGVRVLLRLGANPNNVDNTGSNCFDVAKNEQMKIFMKELLHMSSKKDDQLETRYIYDHLEAVHNYHILEPPLPSSPAHLPAHLPAKVDYAKIAYAGKMSHEENIYHTLDLHSPPSSPACLRPKSVIYNTLKFHSTPTSSCFAPTSVTPLEAPHIYDVCVLEPLLPSVPAPVPPLLPPKLFNARKLSHEEHIYSTLDLHSPSSSLKPTSVTPPSPPPRRCGQYLHDMDSKQYRVLVPARKSRTPRTPSLLREKKLAMTI